MEKLALYREITKAQSSQVQLQCSDHLQDDRAQTQHTFPYAQLPQFLLQYSGATNGFHDELCQHDQPK